MWKEFAEGFEPTINFKEVAESLNQTYPLLDEVPALRWGTIPTEQLKNVIKYINAMDLWIDLAPEEEKEEVEEVEKTA